jgi:uncharacterized protein (UPF0303 family)
MASTERQTDAAGVDAEVEALAFSTFTHDDAWRLGTIITELARERRHPVAIDIRRGEQQVFHAALEGATADNDSWVAKKAAAVRRFERSSLALRLAGEESGRQLAWLDPAVYAVSGGCVPVTLGGALVGTIAVSGLPDVEDHALVVEGIRAFLGAG